MIKLQVQKYLSNNDKKEGKHIIVLLLKIVCLNFMRLSWRLFFYILHAQMKWFQVCVSPLDCHPVIIFQSSIKILLFRRDDGTREKQGNSHATGSLSRLQPCSVIVCNHSSVPYKLSHRCVCSTEGERTQTSWYVWI